MNKDGNLLTTFMRGVSKLPVTAHVALGLALLAATLPPAAIASVAIVMYALAAMHAGSRKDGNG